MGTIKKALIWLLRETSIYLVWGISGGLLVLTGTAIWWFFA